MFEIIWSLATLLGIQSTALAMNGGPEKMYDFTKIKSLDAWIESSDTVREQGMSKASFVLQKTQLFQTSIFFSLLNPQPNGAAFAGYYTADTWNLSQYSALKLRIRAQGNNYHYKMVLRHKGETVNNYSNSYEAFFTAPANEWTDIELPFGGFQAYYRGKPVPNAEPLDTSYISTLGIQIVGGVYSPFKQMGASSLEMDSIKAVQK